MKTNEFLYFFLFILLCCLFEFSIAFYVMNVNLFLSESVSILSFLFKKGSDHNRKHYVNNE
jgi:hypothetical protein